MRLRPLNRTIIIEPDIKLVPVDENPEVVAVAKRGIIIIPERNMVMKISDKAKVVRAAKDCLETYEYGQDIIYDQFGDFPGIYYEEDGKAFRLIKEWYIRLL